MLFEREVMKKVTIFAVLLILVSTSVFAGSVGSSFGTLTTARTMSMGKGAFSVGAGIADYTSVLGSFTYGLSTYTDGRIKFALVDPGKQDDDIHLAFGADFKYHFMSVNNGEDIENNNPFDLAFGGMFEYLDVDRNSVMQIGAKLIASYPFILNNGKTLSAYGAFNSHLESISYDTPLPNGDDSDSNIEFGFNFGIDWQITKSMSFLAEFQLDGNDGLFLGLDFGVM